MVTLPYLFGWGNGAGESWFSGICRIEDRKRLLSFDVPAFLKDPITEIKYSQKSKVTPIFLFCSSKNEMRERKRVVSLQIQW
mmetsp:Transcript_12042/g.24879  ORF Transcript_12042/g.24879 Transcript_12042/m.24879 type:complete len:82 (-) Transcript_12042:61-306(-)